MLSIILMLCALPLDAIAVLPPYDDRDVSEAEVDFWPILPSPSPSADVPTLEAVAEKGRDFGAAAKMRTKGDTTSSAGRPAGTADGTPPVDPLDEALAQVRGELAKPTSVFAPAPATRLRILDHANVYIDGYRY